jgi:hypothetical protein
MIHKEAGIKVYFTRDYSIFKKMSGNRDVNDSKVRALVREINNGFDMLRYNPILVNRNMHVLDGQHRLAAAKEIGSNIWYFMCDDISIQEVARMNNIQQRWKFVDFVECYARTGNEHYQKLKDFLGKYKLGMSMSMALLKNGRPATGGNYVTKKSVEEGGFSSGYYKKAEFLAENVWRFRFLSGKFKTRAFVTAIHEILDRGTYDMDVLEKKARNYHYLLADYNRSGGFIEALDKIYRLAKPSQSQGE